MREGMFTDAATRIAGPVCPDALNRGARNLLVNCAEIQSGQTVLIVHEDPALGWYDAEAPTAVARNAEALGARVTMLAAPCPKTPPPGLLDAIAQSDAVIFFARVGDRQRFCSSLDKHVCVVSYARTAAALASDFGTRDHHQMVALKDRLDQILNEAREIRITCPWGTEITGKPPNSVQIEDVTIRRFPWCMPAPVRASGFSGVVALRGWLTPTGSRAYEPPCLALEEVLFAKIENGRITGFEGSPPQVDKVVAHYERVAAAFEIDPYAVHSWHPGIHTGCSFDGTASEDPDLWANSVFGSPRWLHFHTCGNYAPGEICWMVHEPTVIIDGQAIWLSGELCL